MQAPDPDIRRNEIVDAEWSPINGGGPPSRRTYVGDAPRRRTTRWWLHILLFTATAWTCWLVGGGYYSAGIMTILLAHEMGHYFAAIRWQVEATPPYFIPFPDVPGIVQSPIGTMGAVIAMKSPMPNKRALLDIGAAGPLAGIVVSLVVVILGLRLSSIQPLLVHLPPGTALYEFGDSLLFSGLRYAVLGAVPAGSDVFLHPLARAGWVGFFVTAINLLPIGQLDGGHVLFAMFHKHYRSVVRITTAALIALILVSPVWILFALMAGIVGQKHPPPIETFTSLDRRRRIVGYLCLVVFVLCFIPNPIDIRTF